MDSGQKNPQDLVRHVDSLAWQSTDGARWARAFGPAEGTRELALYAGELQSGTAHKLDAGESEVVAYVLNGRGTASIGGREFTIEKGSGFYVRAREALTLQSAGGRPLTLLMVVCPAPEQEPWKKEFRGFRPAPREFEWAYPERVVAAHSAETESTGDRRFRILVGPKIGSDAVTQFIGSIPLSKAPEHYHQYEEVVCVLKGEGKIRMGEWNAPVRPGSLIFLPREQPHCLECTVEQGIELVGMFYPAGSPGVHYETEDSG